MVKRERLIAAATTAALSLLVACAEAPQDTGLENTDPANSEDEPLVALAHLDVSEDLALEFFEPAPGIQLTSETGRVGGPTLSTLLGDKAPHQLRPSDYFAIFAPDKLLPEALALAERRLAPTSQKRLAAVSEIKQRYALAPPNLSVSKQAGGGCPAEWYQSAQCPGGKPDINWCRLDLTSESQAHGTDVQNVEAKACADLGAVSFVLRAHSKRSENTLQQGFYQSFYASCTESWYDGCNEFNFDSIASPASEGARFHHSGYSWLDD